MPTLKTTSKTNKRNTSHNQTDMRKLRAKAYNNSSWRKLRDTYMHEHPLCEECLSKGKITPAVDVHHKDSPFKGATVNYNKLLDYNNLMSVCKECHNMIHSKQNNPNYKTIEEQIRDLDSLMSNIFKNDE